MKKWFKKHKKAIIYGAGSIAIGILGAAIYGCMKNDNKLHRKLFITYGLTEDEIGDSDEAGKTLPDIYALVDSSKKENIMACKDELIKIAHDNDMTIRLSNNWNE